MSDIVDAIKQILDPSTRQALGMANHYITQADSEFTAELESGNPSGWVGTTLKTNMKLSLDKIEDARNRANGDQTILYIAERLEATCFGILGRGALILDKPKEAIENLERAVLIVTDNAALYMVLKIAYARIGNKNKALEYAETAAALEPDNYALLAEIEAFRKQGAISSFIDTQRGDTAIKVAQGAAKVGSAAVKGMGAVVGFGIRALLKR